MRQEICFQSIFTVFINCNKPSIGHFKFLHWLIHQSPWWSQHFLTSSLVYLSRSTWSSSVPIKYECERMWGQLYTLILTCGQTNAFPSTLTALCLVPTSKDKYSWQTKPRWGTSPANHQNVSAAIVSMSPWRWLVIQRFQSLVRLYTFSVF